MRQFITITINKKHRVVVPQLVLGNFYRATQRHGWLNGQPLPDTNQQVYNLMTLERRPRRPRPVRQKK